MGWRAAADVLVVVHLAFILFVVAGAVAVLRWPRVASVHLPVAAYGVAIQVIGFTCPLTPLEKWLRTQAGGQGYDGGFVEQYVVPVVYPGEFTTGVKLAMAASLLVFNIVVYAMIWRRRSGRIARRSRRLPALGWVTTHR